MALITEASIQRVLDEANILEVVSRFVQVDKKNKACCPFHGEKSPSFHVRPQTGRYKCFGCGAGGDSATFLMEHEKMSFPDAIRWLADFFKIPLEFEQREINHAEENKLKEMYAINKAAAKHYHDRLMNMLPSDPMLQPLYEELGERRQITLETALEFSLGYAPAEWKFLTEKIINKGLYAPAIELGIIKSKNGSNFDSFINRLIFPIHDHKGQIVGFGGRAMNDEEAKEYGKYINSSQSLIYNKDRILYGLYQGAKKISAEKKAVLVEGYFDVTSFHQNGLTNTVAPCGTALTKLQVQLLKRSLGPKGTVIVIFDNDKAGYQATMNAIDLLISEDLKVEVFIFPELYNISDRELIKIKDPDEFCRLGITDLPGYIYANANDAISWKIEVTILKAGESPDDKSKCYSEICGILSTIPDDYKRELYAKQFYKDLDTSVSNIMKRVEQILKDKQRKKSEEEDDEEFDIKLPKHVDKKEYLQYGFYEEVNGFKTGYYFPIDGSTRVHVAKTNFVITPLFHIYSTDSADNKRLIEIDNGHTDPEGRPIGKKILDLNSKIILSVDQFYCAVYDKGYYTMSLNKMQLQKIIQKISAKFPVCYELKRLGQQPEGFFAWYNYIYDKELQPMDQYGICKHNGKNFLSLAASSIYSDQRTNDTEQRKSRVLVYKEPAATFSAWAKQMQIVFGEKGNLGVAFAIMTLFRDLVVPVNNNFPLLYAYGPKQSGKSTFADSIVASFFMISDQKAFNLNQGTDAAFYSQLGKYANCPVAFNEFDEFKIKENWFRAFKGAYDGEGRGRMKMGAKDKEDTQEVLCSVILLGQYVSTKDDGSVLSRAIIVDFPHVESRTDEEVRNYDLLKKWQEEGLSGMLIELLKHRESFEKEFADEYNKHLRNVKAAIAKSRKKAIERIVSNYMKLVACVSLLESKIQFPFTTEEFFNFCKDESIKLSNMIDSTNALAAFWRMTEFLLDAGEIETGYDFVIDETDEVKLKVEDQDLPKYFMGKQQILYIRFSTIHQLYTERLSKKGEQFINMDTLLLYLKTEAGFLGVTRAHTFFSKKTKKRLRTSAYVFEYSKMNVNLERFHDNSQSEDPGDGGDVVNQESTTSGETSSPDVTEDLPF